MRVVAFDSCQRTSQLSVARVVPLQRANPVSRVAEGFYCTRRMGCTCSGQQEASDGQFFKVKHKSRLSEYIVSRLLKELSANEWQFTATLNIKTMYPTFVFQAQSGNINSCNGNH